MSPNYGYFPLYFLQLPIKDLSKFSLHDLLELKFFESRKCFQFILVCLYLDPTKQSKLAELSC
jgi:hypothetical protein